MNLLKEAEIEVVTTYTCQEFWESDFTELNEPLGQGNQGH